MCLLLCIICCRFSELIIWFLVVFSGSFMRLVLVFLVVIDNNVVSLCIVVDFVVFFLLWMSVLLIFGCMVYNNNVSCS